MDDLTQNVLRKMCDELPTKFLILTDQEDIKEAMNASAVKLVLWQYDQWLRSEVKYNENEQAQVYRDKLREIMDEHSVTIE